MADEDTELMLRVAGGDDAAFQPLVRRMLPRLLGYFRRLGADASIAEDCAQEVFVKVFTSLSSFRNEASPSTWILKIATNHCLNMNARVENKL